MYVKLCVFFVLACTLLRNVQGIVGADLVKIEDFGYNVIISLKKSDSPDYYSGSVIHKRFILTSGRIFANVTHNSNQSSVTSVRLRNDVREIEVHVLANHWSYDHYPESESQNNKIIEKVKALYLLREWFKLNRDNGTIAILELQNDLDLSRGIQILKLPTTNLNYMKDYEKFALFTGFGRNQPTKEISSGLRSMEVKIVECPKTWVEFGDWSKFCGGSIILRKNINNSRNQSLGGGAGDSGGPLVYRKNTIIGFMDVIGNGDNRLGQNTPALFSNVSYYLDFIKKVTSGQVTFNDKIIKLIYPLY